MGRVRSLLGSAIDLARTLISIARARGQLDLSFAAYGRRLALSLLLRGRRGAADLLITPVSSMRYWEFPFAWRAVPTGAVRCLDVGSPRLFSLKAADELGAQVLMMNPDVRDAAETERLARYRGLPIRVKARPVQELGETGFDCVWSISVVEHIAGDEADCDAVRQMFGALRPGGRMIITVPVDRTYRLEYRESDEYGLSEETGHVFFQRLYDDDAIQNRLVASVGVAPSVVAWFGEKVAGTWNQYEAAWRRGGRRVTASDPERMAHEYQEFATWGEMPGVGVVGLVFDKPD